MPWTLHPVGTFNGLAAATINGIIGNPADRFYLSGDGHGNPPFQWAVRAAVKEMFLKRMAAGNLCLHVEELPESVSADSIPPIFAPVYTQRQVFGWELAMFRELLPVMELCLEVSGSEENPSLEDVNRLHEGFVRMQAVAGQVNDPPWIAAAIPTSTAYKTYCTKVNHYKFDPRHISRDEPTDTTYKAFLLAYFNSAMQLRTDANNFIGINITNNINRYPAATHLITVGDAHINQDPVQNYIAIPALENGHVDAMK